jgi:hypothetical protein
MNYRLMEYSAKLSEYIFRFDNLSWIGIDLDEYPTYRLIRSQNYSEHETIPFINKIGTIKEFYYKDIRKKDYKIKSYVEFLENNLTITYTRATQTEYDKYCYEFKENNDNGKLYEVLNGLYYDSPQLNSTLII